MKENHNLLNKSAKKQLIKQKVQEDIKQIQLKSNRNI